MSKSMSSVLSMLVLMNVRFLVSDSVRFVSVNVKVIYYVLLSWCSSLCVMNSSVMLSML